MRATTTRDDPEDDPEYGSMRTDVKIGEAYNGSDGKLRGRVEVRADERGRRW
jgi:hypothetical protein